MINRALFESPHLRLAAVDPEADAKVEAAWTADLDYAQEMMQMPARPLAAPEIRKIREERQKEAQGKGGQYNFSLRLKEGDQLVGFVRFPWVYWLHSCAYLNLSVADPGILARYGREALELALVYAFRELNLYRVETALPEYQKEMTALLESAGFLMEVRRRQSAYRGGRYHDLLHYGLLHSEWSALAVEEVRA